MADENDKKKQGLTGNDSTNAGRGGNDNFQAEQSAEGLIQPDTSQIEKFKRMRADQGWAPLQENKKKDDKGPRR